MTTLQSYRGMDEVLRQLDSVRAKQWSFKVATGIVAVLALVLASLLVVAASAGYWPQQPPSALRIGLLAGTCVLWVWAVVWFIARAITWKQNPAQVARFIEQATPELRNGLINSVLLSRDADQVSPELVQHAIHETIRQSRRVNLAGGISMKPLQRWGIVAGVSALALVAFALLQPRAFQRGLMAVLKPTSYVSTQGAVEILKVAPGDATCFANDSITIVADIRNDTGLRTPGRLIVDGKDDTQMRPQAGYSTFSALMDKITQTTRYAVCVGDTRWPTDRKWYVITVLPRVEVESLDLVYEYPGYIGWDRKTVKKSDGIIDAPLGTTATVHVRVTCPVPRAVVYLRGVRHENEPGGQAEGDAERSVMMSRADGHMRFSCPIPVHGNGSYRIEFYNDTGRTVGRLPSLGNADSPETDKKVVNGSYRIHARKDSPPQISFIAPASETTIPPGGKLELKLRASDKYGLTSASLLYGLEGDEVRAEAPKFAPAQLAGNKDLTFTYTLDLSDTKKYPVNSVIEYHATVADNRSLPQLKLGPQTAQTRRFKVTIQDQTKAVAEKTHNFDMLRKRLLTLLEMQAAERVNTEICLKAKAVGPVKTTGGKIVQGQKKILAEFKDLAANFKFDPEMAAAKRAIKELADNEAQLALSQAQVVAALAKLADRDKSATLLGGYQDRIIQALQTLLSILPSMEKNVQRKKKTTGDDLAQDAQEKIQDLKNELEKFVDEQKKVIQATERLAKKPVDAFTEDDEKALKDLAVTEDKWEKFINEAIADFSKLAQQDFANPQLLKELVAVKTDVTMAKDALKKKATEIATAAEDNGVENAKSLTANLEKWLPDEPDRTKWAMEDLATSDQENIEQAELPTELEDLVGDLLEQEEDIFDEMDDVSSKSTTSGDKGIGWDALDGPISSMNAQGVTGNQLPNTSEIHGRSGEGRSGKCTGEFVEDKAVGKGGRRTPTRLTPEPFQKGQVNDTSTEPPGGATGGGKLSGSGEEGLEGPVPPPLANLMKRLAGKQASLLNRAERMRTGLKVSDMSNFRLSQAIGMMDRVFNDLKNYRYQNVLRGRHATLEAIRQAGAKTGQIDVVRDKSSSMPKHLRDNIADAMKGRPPERYRDVIEQYYRRIGGE